MGFKTNITIAHRVFEMNHGILRRHELMMLKTKKRDSCFRRNDKPRNILKTIILQLLTDYNSKQYSEITTEK